MSCSPTSHYTLAFTLQLWQNHGTISVRLAEKRLRNECWVRFGVDLATGLRVVSTALLSSFTLARALGYLGQHSVSVSAELPK